MTALLANPPWTDPAEAACVIRRAWAMPDAETFNVPPIADLLDRWLAGRRVVIDPFARNSRRGTITNDLNPDTLAQEHLPADLFAANLVARRVEADAVLFDPPYSPRQVADCYQRVGMKVGQAETQNAALNKRVRDHLGACLRPGGIAISFGWNSAGFGKVRGYVQREILIVCHGGAHNDTICVVEEKAADAQLPLWNGKAVSA